MSTESGLPDFRSSSGLWTNNRRFEELASVDALRHDYPAFVELYRWRITELMKYQPHAGHRVIAEWQKQGRVQALITQNVDGFHTLAGSPEAIELHGTLRTTRCQQCGRPDTAESFLTDAGLSCALCGGRMRPNVVLFGEMLPEGAIAKASEVSHLSELFIVLGSSLQVSPANWFPQLAHQAGAKLVIINHDPTPLDGMADLTLSASIKDTLEAVAALV
jgi:NAD-dependent deacetylase